jgi:preprotein translocase subunit SecA
MPTNRDVQRIDRNDLIFQTEKGNFEAVARKVKELHEKGQPVLIGTASIEKNELLSAHLKKEGVPHDVLNAKNHESEGEVIAQAGQKGRVTIATNMAGRGVDIKLGGLPSTPEQYEEVKELGGLFVLGTERHEARRIDNQLRGRSGRQGDPGETQFFVSLEDDLMRVFAADRIKEMMGRFGIPEDQPIENKMITNSLESAQTKIEGFHFDARKHVLNYDDVLNKQRHYIYGHRRSVLTGESGEVFTVLNEYVDGDEEAQKAVESKRAELGEEEFEKVVRRLILQTIDMLWMEHLELMEYTRNSVNLRAYGQRNPLVEYKKEGLRLFHELKEAISNQVCTMLPQLASGAFSDDMRKAQEAQKNAQLISGAVSKTVARAVFAGAGKKQEKVGRNDPCPCGSGKKYKKCHGKDE